MTSYPSVCIVILNWNGLNYLKKFLPSVCATSYPNLQIVVGDNASDDESLLFISDNYPQVRTILNDANYGFAGGYNRVLKDIESDYFILLNSDVEVDPGWVEPLINLMEGDHMIAAAQPKILSEQMRNYFEYAGAAGGFIDIFGYPFCRGRIFDTLETDEGQYDESSEIFWASGAALCIKRKNWVEMKGFDEDFFAHMEEIDLCWRLKNHGFKIAYCPQSRVYHVGGGTLSMDNPHKTYLNFRNNLILLQKNLPFYQSAPIIFIRLWLDLLSLIKFLNDGKPAHARAVSKAHVYFFKNFFRSLAKARNNQITGFNNAGLYRKSIVWKYFIQKKRTYLHL